MADTKISALTAVVTPAGTDEFGVNQGGTSKKETLAQIKAFVETVTAPTVNSVGAIFSSTGVPTATLPGTVAQNDILLLILQWSNDSAAQAITGYDQLGPANGIGAAATAGSTKMAIYWKRAGSSESAPTIADTGDHTTGVMLAIRGCVTQGDPFTFGGNNWKFTASTAGQGPKSVTSMDNMLVLDIFGGAIDSTGGQGSSPTNASLSSVTEQFDDSSTDGTGGNIYVVSGVDLKPGVVGSTTVTWAASTVEVCTRLHFIPADVVRHDPDSRQTEVQTFIGSPANLTDTWTKPVLARKIFVQLCDGGGSGSSGNTTTTAAGGGGGGGGGYGEAYFNADDVTATVQLQAGRGGAATTALNQAGNAGVVSTFGAGGSGPLGSGSRVAGTPATAAASADGGNGGCGSGTGSVSTGVSTTRRHLNEANAASARGGMGAPGGSGTTAPTGGSEADWGGGGGESGADTDAGLSSANNGSSMKGGGGGSGGRTNTNISASGRGGGANGVNSAQGANGNDSSFYPYGGSGGVGGGSAVATGGKGGYPGGGGGGGGGVAGGFGGAGGDGCVVVTTFF